MTYGVILGTVIGFWIWAALLVLIVAHNGADTRVEAVLVIFLFFVGLGASIGWALS